MENNQPPIRVVIADDHNMVRKGLMVLFEEFDDLEVVSDVSDGQSALISCETYKPDVVLMDMLMPRMNGIEATIEIRKKYPQTKILILTSFSEEKQVQEAIQAGAIGYLLKNVTGDELANAVRRAHLGQSTLAPEATQALIQATIKPPPLGHDLTSREKEVLELMIDGLNNREIGEALIISSSTVKNHVSKILSKLGTTSRTQAAALAVENGILG